MKKITAIIMVAIMLLMAGCGKKTDAPTSATTEQELPTTQPTEINIPGVEKSIFDDENTTEPTKETDPAKETDPTQPTTKPTDPDDDSSLLDPTTPSGSGSGNNSGKDPTQNTDPSDPTEESKPAQGNQQGATDYERFHAMSPEEQQKYMESFASIDKFFEWYNAAKQQYEQMNPPIDVGGGSVDLGQLAGGKN